MGVTKEWPYSKATMTKMFEAGEIKLNSAGTPSKVTYIGNGCPLQDTWDDIKPVGKRPGESTGYDTQKPVALLERILDLVTDENDWVLDPFCGCGTAIVAAANKKRRWVGIDISERAVDIQYQRLSKMTPPPVFKVKSMK
jgi:site-specific DNA-methyltransferase (adenine-specific)